MAITREQVKAEIDKVEEEHLGTLYQMIKSLEVQIPHSSKKPSLLSKLRKVHVQGPKDFAQNIDQYLILGKVS